MREEYPIITAVGIAAGSAFTMILMMMICSLINAENDAMQLICSTTCPMIISTMIFPFLCTKIFNIDTKYKNNTKERVVILIALFIAFIIPYLLIKGKDFENNLFALTIILHYVALGISEEYLSRVVILKILTEKYGNLVSIVISALIFSFIMHNSESFLMNCLVRVPLGLLFGYITNRTQCSYYTMTLHAIYDLVVI